MGNFSAKCYYKYLLMQPLTPKDLCIYIFYYSKLLNPNIYFSHFIKGVSSLSLSQNPSCSSPPPKKKIVCLKKFNRRLYLDILYISEISRPTERCFSIIFMVFPRMFTFNHIGPIIVFEIVQNIRPQIILCFSKQHSMMPQPSCVPLPCT